MATVVRLLSVCALLFVPIAAAAKSPASPWPKVDTDLPVAGTLVQGTLRNGLQYAILPNAEPKGHVSLRLLVAAGSLVENADERGLAHFVEHMAFRSTKSHPDSSLIPALEKLGLGFGPDTAAFTGYDYTIYHLELPDAAEQAVRDGLRVFREFACEVTFDPRLIEIERGVVLSEAKYRDTPTARRDLANLAFLWPGSRQSAREPIGDVQALTRFTRDQFVAFYDAWYRPERMAIIAVGDVSPDLVRQLITEQFAGLDARAPARPESSDTIPAAASHSDGMVFADRGLTGCTIVLEHPEPKPRVRDTHAGRVKALHLALAQSMLQRRLLRMALDPRTTFVLPSVDVEEIVPGWQMIEIAAAGRIDDWKKVAADLEVEHRRSYLHGFTQPELEAAKAAMAARYDEAIRTVSTWNSEWLANQLALDVRQGNPLVRPADAQRDIAPALEAATLRDCLDAFRAAWTRKAPHIFIAANPVFHATATEIAGVLNQSRSTPVQAYTERPVEKFAYTDFGRAGTLVRDDYHPDLDVRLTEFSNGVRCNFKPTTYEADQVRVHVRVGSGRISQPVDKPGLDLFANTMFTAGGLGRHSIEALSDLLAVSTVRASFSVQSDAFVFSATCSRKDLPFCLEMLAAYLTDAAYREEPLRAAQGTFGAMYMALAASPGGEITAAAPRAMAGGDRRFGIALPFELEARTVGEMKAWLEPQLRRGPIEVSVAGDAAWSDVEPVLAATFGALSRPGAQPVGSVSGLKPSHPRPAPEILASAPHVRQAAIASFWPVERAVDVHAERRLNLLADILAERLRVRLRDELGVTYTPAADFSHFDGFPMLNWITSYAEVDPGQIDRAMQILEREAMSLSLRGPSQDEFERAKQVFVRSMTDELRTNGYWADVVLADAQQRPQRLEAARDRAADLAAISIDELKMLAGCLDPSNSHRFVAAPYSVIMALEGQTRVSPNGPRRVDRK